MYILNETDTIELSTNYVRSSEDTVLNGAQIPVASGLESKCTCTYGPIQYQIRMRRNMRNLQCDALMNREQCHIAMHVIMY